LTRSRVAVLILTLASVFALPVAAHATPTFLSAINISDAGQDGFEPQVAIDGSGNVIAVWTRSDGTNLRIQSANRTPSGPWSAAQTLSDPGQSASSPQVAVDASGNAVAVWTRNDGTSGRIQAAYRPAGGSFGTPATISDPNGDASSPDVSMDNSGRAVIAWARNDNPNPSLCCLRVQSSIRQPGAGGTYSTPQTLSAPGQTVFDVSAAAGPNVDANAAVVWTRSDGTNFRVQSSRRRDPGGFPRPKGATPMRVALVVAYNPCTGVANRQHGGPLNSLSCNPPVQSSGVLTVGTGDANGFSPNFLGSVRYIVVVGNTSTEADEADVKIIASMTDIRNNPSGSDYTGRMLIETPLQITDSFNADENPENGTAQSLNLDVPVDCVATSDTTIGAACNLNTTVDSIVPGAVLENKRNNWQLGQTIVKDAGPNGTGYANCPPTCGDGDEKTFLRSGLWIP
jgi:hypothetical protein